MSGFQELMALASKRTAEQQAALAKEVRLSEERERKRRIEEDRRQQERSRQEQARLAQKRMEEAAREAKLAAERQARTAQSGNSKSTGISRQGHDRPSPASSKSPKSAKPRTSSFNKPAGRVDDPEEVRRLEREAKLARAKAKLFDDDDDDEGGRGRKTASPAPARRRPATKGWSLRGPASVKATPTASAGPTHISARERIAASFAAEPLTRLNTNPRDRRTITEIERDMERRKLAANEASASRTGEGALWGDARIGKRSGDDAEGPRTTERAATNVVGPRSLSNTSTSTAVNETSRPPSSRKRPAEEPGTRDPPRIKHAEGRHESGHAGAARSSAPEARSAPNRGAGTKRHRRSPSSDGSIGPDMRGTIWRIVGGRDRKAYASRDVESGSDDYDSDGEMEAGADEVLFEEGEAARMARLEDKREQEALRKHDAEKRKRLAASRR